MQDVEELSLVLMQSLYLYIEDGVGVYIDAVVRLDILCKANLVLELDLHELLLRLLVIGVLLQTGDLRKVSDPAVTCMCGYPVCKKRVAVKQESSLGDTVGLVVETLREHLVEVLQRLMLQDLRVQSCNTVYRITCNDRHMRHLYLSVIQNRHLADLVLNVYPVLTAVSALDLHYKSAVDLLNDLINSGQQLGEQVDRPLLKCLSHNRMVGICTGSGGDIPCLVPAETIVIQKDTHQLRDGHGRMGIVQLEGNLLGKLSDIIVFSHKLLYCFLNRGRDKEILLL